MKNKYISWRRVSTFKQNKSGLGLEAQSEIIRYFVERDGGELIADYSECYTGTELSGCVELRKAMAHAKKEGAILVIAKSDRFRNCQEALGILTEMGEGNIEFCDLPHSDRFTLTLFWALAEREALITSIRTKQALAAKKARGAQLGGANSKFKETMKQKTKQQIEEIYAKKGTTTNRRRKESKEFIAMIKILRTVFPDATSGEPQTWKWNNITTRGDNKDKIYALMQDYRDMDENGNIFKKWNFNMDARKLQIKLGAFLQAIHKSIMYVN